MRYGRDSGPGVTARAANPAHAANGTDGTDYSRSYTAKSFVPHYAQRISTACVMWGADGILKGISKQSHTNLRRATA